MKGSDIKHPRVLTQVSNKSNEMAYHNQLMVQKAIKNQTQFELIERLIRMGVTTPESVNLVTTLYVSFQPTETEKQSLTQLIDQYISRDVTKNTLINMIGYSDKDINLAHPDKNINLAYPKRKTLCEQNVP